jgi:hypothetical protein
MPMNYQNRGFLIAGITLLTIVLLVLMASPGLLFSPMVTFIDSELNSSSANEISVKTITDFGNKEQVSAFPAKLGKWEGYNYDITEYLKLLGADIMLSRIYQPSTFTQPLFFHIVQAKTESSFHPPEVCFAYQGYQIQSTDVVQVAARDASWVKSPTNITIPMKKLLVTKSSKDGQIIERRVTLFCYIKGNQFYSDAITMIQAEALVPLQGSDEGALAEEKDFISQAMPLMFSPGDNARWQPVLLVFTGWGTRGYLTLSILLVIPFLVMFYPKMRKKRCQ